MSWTALPALLTSPATGEPGVKRLGVADFRVNLPEAIAACADLHVNAASVLELSRGRGGGRGHQDKVRYRRKGFWRRRPGFKPG